MHSAVTTPTTIRKVFVQFRLKLHDKFFVARKLVHVANQKPLSYIPRAEVKETT